MINFAENVLDALKTRLLQKDIPASLNNVGNNSYKALMILPKPFNPEYSEKRNTIILWSLSAVSGKNHGKADQIKLFCKLYDSVNQAQRGKLLDYLNYANTVLDFGTFCIDSKGQVEFDYTYPLVDHGNCEAEAETLDFAIGCAVFALKTADMPLQKLIKDSLTLSEAKNLLEILLEVIDENICN